ncbi:HNH endonuclease [Phaeocystis globosa virus]|uniref:HNH endonuclease n=1 Tax=Phaeocystis globosa virus PgV-16T TaxID=3071227 RepID=A0AC59EWP9_9VIRU|nr:HNH endonuclease [Phaeocystis globosa virus]AGM15384.1 HNH endonuclease [Phaeocystis globosa virus PgV-16T]UYE94114.1 HNH endonuclease [Phaeocystis globosa virus]
MDDNNTAERWEKTDAPYDYFVSTSGRVKNKRDRIMKQQLNEGGYYLVGLCYKKQKKFLVSRLVATAFVPNPHNLPEVHHINKDPTDNRASNLMWVTAMENLQSVNKNVNIGCVYKCGKTFQARVKINGIRYQISNVNEDKCLNWLNARRYELENGLELTDLDIKQYRKRGTGSISISPSGTFNATISKNNKIYTKTFDTNEDAEKWLETFM